MKYTSLAREHLEKARDSALLAVEFYNKPAVRFKAGGYITMMSIAWTSLFHAIFFKRRIKPFYRDKKDKRRYEKQEGDFRYWELSTAVKEFFGGKTDPVKANIEFFIPLRNRIEHRSMPRIDSTIFAECQAWLLNFDELIASEFGESYALRESLSFSLQLFPKGAHGDLGPMQVDEAAVLSFITQYRSALSADLYANPKFAFKAFLIRVGNHNTNETLPIKFVDFDSLDHKAKAEVEKFAALIKTRHIPVLNSDLYKPAEVVRMVQLRLGNPKIQRGNGSASRQPKEQDRFNENIHTEFWKKYKARPLTGAPNPAATNARFCVYDRLNKNYGYTIEWVDFLASKVADDAEYRSVLKHPEWITILPKTSATT